MPENKSGTTNKNQKAKETVNKAESVAKSTGTQKKTTAKASAAKEASSSAKKPASASKSSTTSKVSTKEKETKDVKATSKTQVNKEAKKSTINPTIESVDASNNTKEIKAKPASPKAEEAKEELKSVHEKQEKEAKKETISLLTAVGFLLLFGITITCILAVQSCSNSKDEYSNPYKTSTKVGYEAEVLGTVKRTIPTEEKNEGRSSVGYPKYGYTLKECIGTDPEKVEMRNAIIGESSYLTTVNTWNGGGGGYNRFDSEGYLYLRLLYTR